jgi:predicted DNA binding protein
MSDGWGDASGIEGNYEDDDDEEETNEISEVNETAETSSPTEMRETSSTSKTKKSSKTKGTSETKTNIKEEWNGRTIYIPDGILDDLEDTYLESQLKLRKAGQDELKKNRHFYPLLVQFGLEALSDADSDDIQARLSNIGNE